MNNKGSIHPITQFIRESIAFFEELGFDVHEGNDIESEWYNFDALNVSKNHPSRDMHDTFWVSSDKPKVLRTHTTGTESRIINELKLKPPLRIIVPGRIYRNERTDISHEHTFNQIDGIIIDKTINVRHLIGVLSEWMKVIFGSDITIRIQPSYFPFVEPGLEIHAKLPDGKWREMLGAGMAHPIVLKNMGINPDKWQALMFGTGIDRYAMLKYNIDDIRRFHSQDLRFLKQF